MVQWASQSFFLTFVRICHSHIIGCGDHTSFIACDEGLYSAGRTLYGILGVPHGEGMFSTPASMQTSFMEVNENYIYIYIYGP